jgi:putative tricarboxylic transport membrane protein
MVIKSKDTITGMTLALFSVIVYIATFSIRDLGITNVGAAFFPGMCAIAVFFLSLVLIIQDQKKFKGKKKIKGEISKEGEISLKIKNVLISLVILFVSIFMLKPLGFIISMSFYLICSFIILTPKGKRNYLLFAVISFASTNAVYWIFVKGFKTMLPSGLFG